MIVTVADIMKLEQLKNSPVKAGFEGLGNAVSAITIIEAPDIADWIYGGEILLTTLYGVTQANLPLKEYFEKLAQKGISAIMVKTGRMLQELPTELISVGNAYNIPVIELQLEVRYVDLINSGTRLIIDSQEQKLSYYMDIQRKLTKLMISGASVEEIIKYLEGKVHAKLTVLDEHHTELFYKAAPHVQSQETDASLTVPITCFGKTQGYLQALSAEAFSEEQCVVLKNAADIIAMEFMKRHYIAEIEQKYANDFMDELLSGNIDLPHVHEKIKLYEIDKQNCFMIAVVQAAQTTEQAKAISEEIFQLYNNRPGYLCRVRRDSITILWHGSQKEKNQAVQRFADGMKTNKTLLHCGVSSYGSKMQEIGKLQSEALSALNYAKLFGADIVNFGDMGVLKLFSRFSSREELAEMIPDCIRLLQEHDRSGGSAYLQTLDVVVECNYNLSLSAKKLYVHYKTMLHRAQRICEVGKISFESSHDRLQLEIGLKLLKLLREF